MQFLTPEECDFVYTDRAERAYSRSVGVKLDEQTKQIDALNERYAGIVTQHAQLALARIMERKQFTVAA